MTKTKPELKSCPKVTHEMIVASEEAYLAAYYPEKRDFVLSPIDSHQYNAHKASLIAGMNARPNATGEKT